MGPVRRVFCFICALTLIFGGTVSFFYLLLFAAHARMGMVAGAGMVAFLGLYWLWVDFINATPNEQG